MKTAIKNSGKIAFDKDSVTYVYILIRQDISPSQQGVQAVHAGMQAIHEYKGLERDTRLVLLSVKDEYDLLYWKEKTQDLQINHEVFFEPDNEIGWSALATAPISRREGKIFKKLPKWSI